jgi:hypothetical protein
MAVATKKISLSVFCVLGKEVERGGGVEWKWKCAYSWRLVYIMSVYNELNRLNKVYSRQIVLECITAVSDYDLKPVNGPVGEVLALLYS